MNRWTNKRINKQTKWTNQTSSSRIFVPRTEQKLNYLKMITNLKYCQKQMVILRIQNPVWRNRSLMLVLNFERYLRVMWKKADKFVLEVNNWRTLKEEEKMFCLAYMYFVFVWYVRINVLVYAVIVNEGSNNTHLAHFTTLLLTGQYWSMLVMWSDKCSLIECASKVRHIWLMC